MASLARLNFVTLGVSDVARATVFYVALGWERSSASQDEIAFMRGALGTGLILWSYDALAEDAALPPGRGSFGGQTLAVNVAEEADVASALAAAEAAGGRILKPAARADWGGVSGYFADPDGYPWEAAYNPFFPLDDDGVVHLP